MGYTKDFKGFDVGQKVRVTRKGLARHGLITGTTGSGKTTSVLSVAKAMYDIGIMPLVFDVKGDVPDKLSSLFPNVEYQVIDIYDGSIMTSVYDMGAPLLSSVLSLTKPQEDVLGVLFEVANNNGMPLYTIRDLCHLIRVVDADLDFMIKSYGHVSRSSMGVILRKVVLLSKSGTNKFFGKSDKHIIDMIFNPSGIMILDCSKLIESPRLYRAVIAWIQSELYNLLESNGADYAIFIDESHIVFDDAPISVVRLLSRILRLIRSKGVSIWYISQYPNDIPDSMLGMIGNKIQHQLLGGSLYAQKAIRSAQASLPIEGGGVIKEHTIRGLKFGEVFSTWILENGQPSITEKHNVKIN